MREFATFSATNHENASSANALPGLGRLLRLRSAIRQNRLALRTGAGGGDETTPKGLNFVAVAAFLSQFHKFFIRIRQSVACVDTVATMQSVP